MIFGIAHNFHASATGANFVALGNGLDGVVRALGMHIRTEFADDRAHIRLRKNHHGIYIGQRGQNFGTFLGRHQRTALPFQGAHRGIRVHGYDQSPAQFFGRAQITDVSDVQQVEAAIGQGDRVAGAAPFCYLLF
jgi:hypothetical protein